ncbi:hypothetical protein I8G32_04409 [Rhodopseudomonas palustris]|nr:hypothetical protein [Rhodopseudomonas palustris]OPF92339.1 hypothetical protein B1S06_14225 [Rhodopseudomonas palustris]QQM05838.1 hypothetical protein I8G32_04409 [Rhodopseudomonas palustris]RJF64050.1 hypothetical protein D4Q71_13245 [Rhodopseudomonas palustris]WAB77163.1 hypothetical protein OR798_22150 [Rhodopseudomonas palustris]WCL94464.1 hypothetical protein TX73_022145 [Rhodopseudomonas palustris CGA009]
MAVFLKIVSGAYLILVWLSFFIGLQAPLSRELQMAPGGATILLFLIAVLLSIPGVALFAFGQLVGDVRAIRNSCRPPQQ